MTPQAEAPQIDLSTGLVPKKKPAAPRVDLSAGLVAKVKSALSLNDLSLDGAHLTQPSPEVPSVPPGRTKLRHPPLAAAPNAGPVAYEPGAETQVEPPPSP